VRLHRCPSDRPQSAAVAVDAMTHLDDWVPRVGPINAAAACPSAGPPACLRGQRDAASRQRQRDRYCPPPNDFSFRGCQSSGRSCRVPTRPLAFPAFGVCGGGPVAAAGRGSDAFRSAAGYVGWPVREMDASVQAATTEQRRAQCPVGMHIK